MIPAGADIKGGAISRLPSEFMAGWGVLNDFLTHVCGDISTAWAQWQSGLLAGDNNVVGVGIGAWAGTGSGGKLTQGSPFNVVHTWPNSDPAGYWNNLKAAITAELKEEFAVYASSYTFSSVPYVGASTATPLSPGAFTAVNTPGTLAAYKASATAPSSFASGVRGKLGGQGDANQGVLQPFLEALQGSIDEQFSKWESSAMVSGDTAAGVAAPGAGAGVGVSAGTGVVA